MSTPRDRCSLRSEQADEPLAGSASTVRRWLLVEHPGPWGRQGLLDARLPDGLGVRLQSMGHRTRTRVLLIRRPDRHREPGVTCFAVDAMPSDPWMGTLSLDRIEDADALDARERGGFRSIDGPLALVCTHGRRDPCCAERGRPLANATAAAFPAETWESTHVGGDRFAANMVVFPHGLYFGHLEAVRGPEVVQTYRNGRIVLDRFRGRCSVPMPAQAAEAHVRALLDLDGVDDVVPVTTVMGSDEVLVSLRVSRGGNPGGGSVYTVRIRPDLAAAMRLTCHAPTEEAPHRWIVEGVDPVTSR